MATSDTPELSACSETTPTAKIFPQSSFFQEHRAAALPSPTEIRALNDASGNHLVKYGTNVTTAELETQVLMHERLQGRVPISEVFGWAEDRGQLFIYMSLVEGDTLQARFSTMNESERQAICKELRSMVSAWRALAQESDIYIGSVGKRPLSDIFVAGQPERIGPFLGTGAVQNFHDTCGIDISDNAPIVVGILDWGQSGWYPAYWEYCKARQVGIITEKFNSALLEEWHTSYVRKVVDTVDDERFYHPWLYFMLANLWDCWSSHDRPESRY
ncbi:hypothetical protein BGZ63DRAFT_433254 [Mariannaea sp. PMI_226]|nr:hypothetical protein BGZ63DRAFT_433254 [Mariannaea sp. PMI_226]